MQVRSTPPTLELEERQGTIDALRVDLGKEQEKTAVLEEQLHRALRQAEATRLDRNRLTDLLFESGHLSVTQLTRRGVGSGPPDVDQSGSTHSPESPG